MQRTTDGQLVTYSFESIPHDRVVQAIFSRLGGVSHAPFATLNIGSSVGDDPEAVAENHMRVYARMGLAPACVATGRQVHGNRVAVVTPTMAGQVLPATDGLVTNVPGLALLLRLADCQPVILYDSERHVLGLVHAGWRGVAQGIAHRAVEVMQQQFGCRPESIVAGLGPAIGPCCYIVGDEVAAAMGYALRDWRRAMSAVLPADPPNRTLPEESPPGAEAGTRTTTGTHQPQEARHARAASGQWRLDLSAANELQLAAAGLRQIERSDLCTACHVDEFYSHRAEGGRTGRFAAVAYLRPGAARPDRPVRKPRPAQSAAEPPAVHSLNPPGLPGFHETADWDHERD